MALKHAFRRLGELSQEIQDAVRAKLLAGETPSAVANFLQVECGVLKDIKPASLKKNLERYRSTDLKNAVVNEIVEKFHGKNTANTHKQFVALNELETLAILQGDRVQKMLVKEKTMPGGILLKQVSDEMRLLKEMLVEVGKLQLETGIGMRRAPKTLSGTISDPGTGQVREFSWTEEADSLLKIIDGHIIDHEAA